LIISMEQLNMVLNRLEDSLISVSRSV